MISFFIVGLGNLKGEGRGEGAGGKASENFSELGTGLGSSEFTRSEAGFNT